MRMRKSPSVMHPTHTPPEHSAVSPPQSSCDTHSTHESEASTHTGVPSAASHGAVPAAHAPAASSHVSSPSQKS
eukprot:943429-Rhodomonas_salina.1